MTTATRNDTHNVGLIENALRMLRPGLEQTEYPEYKFADPDRFVPRDPTQAPGVDAITRQRITYVGQWRLAGDYANNIDEADFYLQSVTYGAKYFEQRMSYSSQELDRMAFANANNQMGVTVNIVSEKYNAVDESYMQLLNRLFAVGIPALDIWGLLNHPDVPRISAPYTLGPGRTPDENLALLDLLVTTVLMLTEEVEQPDTALFTLKTLRFLNQQRVGSTSDTTVLQHWLKTNGYITDVDSAPQLDTAGPGNTPIAMVYRRDPRKVVGMIPKPKTAIGGVQQVPGTGKFTQVFDAQVSGTHFLRPYSGLIMEGVA